MTTISSSDFQKGMFLEFKGEIHQIVEFQHVNPGKGSAFIKTKLRQVKTGSTHEFTYKSGEKVEQISIYIKEMQFLYKSGTDFTFMDKTNFEQINIEQDVIGDFSKYLKEGNDYQIYLHEIKGVGLKTPKKVKLTVIEAEEGAKGNTVSGAKKTVKLETGITIQVPLFIKKGDLIAINPDSGEYLERVN